MLGFIHTETVARPGWGERIRCAVQKGYGTEALERPLFGRPALFVRHRNLNERNPIGEMLLERGVDKVLFSEASGVSDVPLRRMDRSYLYTYLAGDVGAHVAERSGATAVCFFRTLGQLEERALLKLAGVFRYLMISVQRDSGAICRDLRRRYGLPVVEDPTPNQVKGADFALVLHPPGRDVVFSGRCLLFEPNREMRATEGGRACMGTPITGLDLDVPPDLAAEIPAGFRPLPILSEAAFRGQIDPARIKIHGVSLDKSM
ncbi:MAG: hypothetical protein FWE12_06885 [Oscillospiraceae bacterium]|nr:hypothetical protein [Oscillospiraceae bacterium]